MSQLLYNTIDPLHPGINIINNMKPILLSGNIDLRQTYRRHSTDCHHESRII